jgi:FixJ family two-component response regulator
MSVRAMKRGAIEFLTKPFRDQDLLDAIELAIARDRAHRDLEQAVAKPAGPLNTPTPHEPIAPTKSGSRHSRRQIAQPLQ